MVAAAQRFHEAGATIVNLSNGKNSRDHGVELFHEALLPPKPSREFMQRLQALGAEKKTRGRMPQRTALRHWRNPDLSTEEALELMPGWTHSSAYKELEERLVPRGRRPKAKP